MITNLAEQREVIQRKSTNQVGTQPVCIISGLERINTICKLESNLTKIYILEFSSKVLIQFYASANFVGSILFIQRSRKPGRYSAKGDISL